MHNGLQSLTVSIAALARAKQEGLDHLPAEYYQQEYDSVAGELALLPRMFTEADLESVVEERSGVLEVQGVCFYPDHAVWHRLYSNSAGPLPGDSDTILKPRSPAPLMSWTTIDKRALHHMSDSRHHGMSPSSRMCCADCVRAPIPACPQQLLQVCGWGHRGRLCRT